MKSKLISLRSLPFLISATLVGVLVSAPSLGWAFPEWPAVSLEALGALALIGAMVAQDEARQ